ncbi:hypothetical protein COSHB9_11370 [Companilactobacillus alimentarius]
MLYQQTIKSEKDNYSKYSKYAAVHKIPVIGWNIADTILSFCIVRKISKLGLILSNKLLRIIWLLSHHRDFAPD